jgi:predicted RNA binding protein YcfA (HicA-like mRNA interferase family)
MRLEDVFAALEHAGGFTWQRSRRKQSHYHLERVDVPDAFTLPVGHDGEVTRYWVIRLRRHFALNDYNAR